MFRLAAITIVSIALFAQPATSSGDKRSNGGEKLITITFRDTPLSEALHQLGKFGLNYVCSKEVLESAPRVNARLKDVPLIEAAKAIVTACGLYYAIESERPARIRIGKDP